MSTDIKALEALGRFADYSDEDLARQCRFQARSETLDPDYEKFMRAVALRLDALASAMAALEAQSSIVTAHVENGGEGRDSSVMRGWLERIAEERRLREAAEARLEELTRERDELRVDADGYLEELGKVVMACPMLPGMRVHPTSEGVRKLRTEFEAATARLEETKAALRWYEEQARALTKYMTVPINVDATEAVITALSLDGGNRARAFLHQGCSDAR